MALVLSSDSIKFGLFIIAATLLSSCLSGPARYIQIPKENQWWPDACNSKIRHIRSIPADVLAVKNQLKIFATRLKIGLKKIGRLYDVKTGGKERIPKLKWLKIKKMLTETKRAKLQYDMLEKFQENLQHFAFTLEVLRTAQIKTESTLNQSERRNIYKDICNQLKTLLCELQDTIRKREDKDIIPKSENEVPKKDSTDKILIPLSLSKTMDSTEAHMIDLIFFRKTLSFVKKSQSMLFKKKAKKVTKKTSVVKNKRT